MAKRAMEQAMIDSLDSNFSKVTLIYKNVLKNPDVGFAGNINGTDYFFVLEAKKYDENNRSNYPKQLLTEVLINRDEYKKGNINNTNRYQETFGVLLSYDKKMTDGVYSFLKDHIDNSDWINFGRTYNCKFAFLYDETGKQLYYQEWTTFLSCLNPISY